MDAPTRTELAFREVRRETIDRGRKFDYERVVLADEGGREVAREMVRHPGAVCILPITDAGEVVFVRNERFTVGRRLLELPAGTIEQGEPPETCAVRELAEETGYECGHIQPIGSFLTTPGMTDEGMHAFCATGLTHVGQRLEPDERMTVELWRADEALTAAADGRIEDAKSICTLLIAHRRGLLTHPGT